MAPLVVVEPQVALERGLELPELREVATPKLDAPVLVQDRLLQPLDEAVGKGVPRFRPRVTDDGILPAGFVEDALEFASTVGEDPLHGMPRLAEAWGHSFPEEVRSDAGAWRTDEDLSEREGRSRIAGRDLPHRPDALELSDVEAVEADERGITGSCVAPGEAWGGGMRCSELRNPLSIPAGSQSRPAKAGHQPEPSVAWRSGNRRCEAYTGSAQAA